MFSRPIHIIGFDADDTLWHNENLFRTTEAVLADMLAPYDYPTPVSRVIYESQMRNLPLYGYGIKSFTLAMLETAIEVSGGDIPARRLEEIMQMGKEMLRAPVILFDHVEETLRQLSSRYRLMVITKGDQVDQERKLEISGLKPFFHNTEIMITKEKFMYEQLLASLDIAPEHFLMIGNSLKSDILPVLELGGRAIHIPYRTTWEHELVQKPITLPGFMTAKSIKDVLPLLLTH